MRLADHGLLRPRKGTPNMDHRQLGGSGKLVSAVAYGNGITHGSQVDQNRATASVRAALDAGITTFDIADVFAETRAEEALGTALKGVRREGVEICAKVYFLTGPGKNDRSLSCEHLVEVETTAHSPPRHGLRGSVPGSPLRLRHSARGSDGDRHSPRGQGALHRRLGVENAGGQGCGATGTGAEDPPGGQPASVLHALAPHRAGDRPGLPGAGHRTDRVVPARARGADGQVQAGPVPVPPTRTVAATRWPDGCATRS